MQLIAARGDRVIAVDSEGNLLPDIGKHYSGKARRRRGSHKAGQPKNASDPNNRLEKKQKSGGRGVTILRNRLHRQEMRELS